MMVKVGEGMMVKQMAMVMGRMMLTTVVRQTMKGHEGQNSQNQVTDLASPTNIEFYKHFQLNGSWEEDVDGRLHVKMIQSSNDLPPPENDQVKSPTVKLISKTNLGHAFDFRFRTLASISLFIITCHISF